MPFADHRGLIAGLLHQFREGLLGSVELVSISQKAILMRILSSLNGGPLRAANRVGYVATLEQHAFRRQAIDMRGLIQATVVGANRLVGVVGQRI